MAEIKLHGSARYECKQPKHSHLPRLPTRGVFLAPSQQFKTTAMVSLILDHYRECFARIVVLSPTVDIDHAWDPVKEFSREELGFDEADDRKCFFETFDAAAL